MADEPDTDTEATAVLAMLIGPENEAFAEEFDVCLSPDGGAVCIYLPGRNVSQAASWLGEQDGWLVIDRGALDLLLSEEPPTLDELPSPSTEEQEAWRIAARELYVGATHRWTAAIERVDQTPGVPKETRRAATMFMQGLGHLITQSLQVLAAHTGRGAELDRMLHPPALKRDESGWWLAFTDDRIDIDLRMPDGTPTDDDPMQVPTELRVRLRDLSLLDLTHSVHGVSQSFPEILAEMEGRFGTSAYATITAAAIGRPKKRSKKRKKAKTT